LKTRILLFYICITASIATAQNWWPINKAWHYNYRFDNANLVTNTILVDSAKAIGNDSIFYLNRILLDCDTCHAASFGLQFSCDTCFVLGNQPQFLQRTIIKKQNGIYQFKDTGNIVLPVNAAVGTTWLFDSVWNVSATIISANFENIFATTDSVKTILLSSGDTIKLSKNFGILLYPYKYGLNKYHRLTGIEDLQVGEHVPDYKDFYNFNVGDEFLYELTFTIAGNPNCTGTYLKQKLKVISKIITNDTLIYTYRRIKNGYIQSGDCSGLASSYAYTLYTDTISEIITNQHECNKYNNYGLIDVQNYYPGNGHLLAKMQLIKDTLNNFFKNCGLQNWATMSTNFSQPSYQYNGSNNGFMETNIMWNPINNLYVHEPNYFYCNKTYKTGLGLIKHGFAYFEIEADTNLIAYTKNGITVGNMIPDNILLSAKNISRNANFSITPNPCSTCYISGVENINDIQITNILGFEIKPTILKQNAKIEVNMQNYPSGIYFVGNKKTGIFSKFLKE